MIRTLFCLLLGAALATPAELPVTQVVLYKHGVGFFERAGTLGPGESARLDFDAAEMNGVLKSLTIDERGGKISGLTLRFAGPAQPHAGACATARRSCKRRRPRYSTGWMR